MGLLIVDGQAALRMSIDQWRAGPLMEMAASRGFVVPPPTEVADVPPIPAHIIHGKLTGICPDCGGSEYLWKGRAVMMCASCWNGVVGFLWRPVAFPDDLPLLSAILSRRPLVQTQNWHPGETATELEAENLTHGVS